jgi:hypothetical protein
VKGSFESATATVTDASDLLNAPWTAVPHHNRAGVVYGTLGAFILASLACEAGRWRWQLRRVRQGSAALATPPPTRASPALSRSLPSSLTSAPTLFITWDPTAPANLFTLYRLDVLLLFTFILPLHSFTTFTEIQHLDLSVIPDTHSLYATPLNC